MKQLSKAGLFTVKFGPVPGVIPSAERQHESSLLSLEEKRDLVKRILESDSFRKSPAMRRFLLYITDHAEAGRADQLKEQTIGVEVLARRVDYDPAKDNIVRVRAHELRGRLMRYFASEGVNERVVLAIPAGGYAPEFLPRSALWPDISPKPEPSPTTPGNGNHASRLWWRAVQAGLLLAAILAYVLISRYQAGSRARTVVASAPGAIHDFWAQFFSIRKDALNVVYADSSIALWQRLSGKDLNLGDYLSHKYLDGPDNRELLEVVSQRATSPADISTSLHLQSVAAELDGQVNTQFARNIDAEFLHQGNVVLIGSRRSNPWVEAYEQNLNFQLRLDAKTSSPYFFNRSPLPHESPVYAIPAIEDGKTRPDGEFIHQAEEKEFLSYGLVVLMRECSTNRLTVLLEGLNEQATQAAGDLVTDPQSLERLLERLGHTPGSNVAPFQALFQITSLPGGYDNLQVVAYRVSTAGSCIGN